VSTIEQDAARIAEAFRFFRFPGELKVSHDEGLACLDVTSVDEINVQNLWLTIGSHRALNGNTAMRITLNGKLHRICPHCNILRSFESLDQDKCESCLKPSVYYKPDPIKQKARGITNRAIKNGLVRGEPDACEDCGCTDENLTVHHKDYSEPLDIEWLCTTCHGRRHRGWRKYYAFKGYAEARMAWSD
jgi:hypothetical protein